MRTTEQLLLSVLLSTLVVLPAGARGDEDDGESPGWPQWRGPTRDGRATGAPWPASLSPERLVQVWSVAELGPSYSGPVVDADHVYTTETVDRSYETVRALDRLTGEEVWRSDWKGSIEVPFFAARNGSWIRSTPAASDGDLFVAGMRDVLKCLDAKTGEVRWSVDFSARFGAPLPPFGCVSSPLVTDDHLYIQAGGSLVKLDRTTGESVWRTMVDSGDMMEAGAFSSPVLSELAGRPQLVVQSRVDLAGVDPEDGSILWSTPVRAFRGMNILTPTVIGDAVYTSAYGGRSSLFAVTPAEAGLRVEQAWSGSAQGYMTSPVVVDGCAYLFLKSNRFGCIDLATGEERWTSAPTGDSYWSLAVQADRILALSDRGRLLLVRASPSDFEILSEREVSKSETWAHVAVAGGQVFVRSLDSLIAFSWR